jgi:hypothetical protein
MAKRDVMINKEKTKTPKPCYVRRLKKRADARKASKDIAESAAKAAVEAGVVLG